MISNDQLECFILEYGLEPPHNLRSVPLLVLHFYAKDRCGECSMRELLNGLLALKPEYAELTKTGRGGGKLVSRNFNEVRHHANWRDFFYEDFCIEVFPEGERRYQELRQKLEAALLKQADGAVKRQAIGFRQQ